MRTRFSEGIFRAKSNIQLLISVAYVDGWELNRELLDLARLRAFRFENSPGLQELLLGCARCVPFLLPLLFLPQLLYALPRQFLFGPGFRRG